MGDVNGVKYALPISFGRRMKALYLVLLSGILLNIGIPKVEACTTFFLRNGEQIVVGRNFDLSYGKYLIFANRRNVTKVGLQYPGESIALPAVWTSKYGSITFNMVGSDIPTDGMNEAGLVISTLILDNSVYPAGSDLPTILVEQWLHYMLDNFGTVEEVIEASSNLKIRNNPFINWELHFFVTDNSGTCAAIEFIDGQIVITTGSDLEKKVLANSSYESSLEYFYNGRDPDRPMTASLNRFYTAVEMTDDYANENIVDYSYSIMDEVEQYFTQRKIVYDISNMRVYLKSLENEQLRYFDMNTFDFSCQEQTLVYDETLNDVGNIRSLFVPLTLEINQSAVESGWNYMNVTYTEQELSDYSQVPLGYECVFANAGNDVIFCENNYEVTGNVINYYAGSWSVVSGSGVFDNSLATNTFIRQIGNGENVIRWTLEGNSRTFYDDVVITNNGVEANAGEDVTVCENEYTLFGNEPLTGEQGTWEIISGSGELESLTKYNSEIEKLSIGETELQWKITKGDCQATDLVKVTYSPVEANAGEDAVVCENEYTLSGNEPLTGEQGSWKIISGSGEFESLVDYNSLISNLSGGETELQWLVSNGKCTASDLVTINYVDIEVNAGVNAIVCENKYTLAGNLPKANEVGQWQIISGSGNIQSISTYNSSITDLSKGIVELQWSISNRKCIESDLVQITNNTVIAYAGSDAEICGSETSLGATNPFPNVGTWRVVKGNAEITELSSNNSTVEELEFGETHFEWKVTEPGGCSASDIVIVTNHLVLANAGEDQSVINNSTYLTANEPESGTGRWSVLEGEALFSDENQYNTLASELDQGLNRFIWEITNGNCTDKDTVSITYEISSAVITPEGKITFNIYPNPTDKIINFTLENSENRTYRVKIVNSTGQMVFFKDYAFSSMQSNHSIDIGSLPKGVYMLSVISQKSEKSKKFLKL